jgi:hypothetical protein
VRKAPFLILQPSRKRPLDTAGLRAHCAQQVENGQAAQVVESLLNLVESLAERCDRLELTLGAAGASAVGKKE